MKKYIKLITALLCLTLTLALASCESEPEETEKTLTICNSTDFILTEIKMAPTEAELESDSAIVIFDINLPMNAKSANDFKVKFPADKLTGNWFIAVEGSNYQEQSIYTTTVDLGDVFNDDPTLFLDDVYGFEITVDKEDDNFVVTPLDGSAL